MAVRITVPLLFAIWLGAGRGARHCMPPAAVWACGRQRITRPIMKYLRTTLTVRGPAPDITRFRAAVLPCCRAAVLPCCPQAIALICRLQHWYRSRSCMWMTRKAVCMWATEWGTPWDVRAILLVQTGQCLDYEFKECVLTTRRVARRVSAQFPLLQFLLEYEDPLEETHGRRVGEGREVPVTCVCSRGKHRDRILRWGAGLVFWRFQTDCFLERFDLLVMLHQLGEDLVPDKLGEVGCFPADLF